MDEKLKVAVQDLRFDCRVAGNESWELIIFLHGFPETSFMWKNLMNDVSKLGFYCVAPNLRGYSREACPEGIQHYLLKNLAGDVKGIASYFGKDKFHLVGHDWGAAIGWKVVHDSPTAILSWTALSIPHLQSFGEAIVNDKEQRHMSRYIKSFQWPFLPERKIRTNDFELFKRLWKNSSQAEVEDYLSVFKSRRQLTAALNYYRSNYRHLKEAAKREILGDINIPTLFIWGKEDFAIGSAAVEKGHKYMKNDYLYLELNGGHWLIQTKYDEIKSALSTHLLKHKLGTKKPQ